MGKHESEIEDTLFEKRKVPSFGKHLKTEREKKGISLEEIYQTTKIQVHFLEALEADHFEALPVPVLIRGYIRSIAEAIDLSPDETVRRYDKYLVLLDEADKEVEEKKKSHRQPLDIPLERNFTIALAATITLGIALTVIYLLFPDIPEETDTSEKADIVIQQPAISQPIEPTVIVEEEPITDPPVKEEETIAETSAPIIDTTERTTVTPLNREDGINFTLKFYILDESWVKVKVDNEEPRNFMLRNNTQATFYAKEEMVVDLGRVSSTELIVNDVNIAIPQPSSNVIKGFVINNETVKGFVPRENLLDRSKAIPAEIMAQRAQERMEREREEQLAEAAADATEEAEEQDVQESESVVLQAPEQQTEEVPATEEN